MHFEDQERIGYRAVEFIDRTGHRFCGTIRARYPIRECRFFSGLALQLDIRTDVFRGTATKTCRSFNRVGHFNGRNPAPARNGKSHGIRTGRLRIYIHWEHSLNAVVASIVAQSVANNLPLSKRCTKPCKRYEYSSFHSKIITSLI